MLHQLIYTSTSCLAAPGELSSQLANIRHVAEKRNRELAVTGVLFACDSKFTQVIEGSFDSLTALYTLICRDKRHRDVTLLNFRKIETRQFEEWDMLNAMDQIIAFPSRPRFKIEIVNTMLGAVDTRPCLPVATIVDIGREAIKLQRQAEI